MAVEAVPGRPKAPSIPARRLVNASWNDAAVGETDWANNAVFPARLIPGRVKKTTTEINTTTLRALIGTPPRHDTILGTMIATLSPMEALYRGEGKKSRYFSCGNGGMETGFMESRAIPIRISRFTMGNFGA